MAQKPFIYQKIKANLVSHVMTPFVNYILF